MSNPIRLVWEKTGPGVWVLDCPGDIGIDYVADVFPGFGWRLIPLAKVAGVQLPRYRGGPATGRAGVVAATKAFQEEMALLDRMVEIEDKGVTQ